MNRDVTYGNSHKVDSDASSAKAEGMSYGKYKAGFRSDYAPSEYSVRPTEYVKKSSSQTETAKAAAFIR